MEQIIRNLLVSDNEIIKKATADLQEAYKNPESIPALCEIIVSSSDSQVRQYSAVLIRKRLQKFKNWQLVPENQQILIKQGMLNALTKEPEKSVRNAIAQFIGVLIKHESTMKGPWMNDVLKFIFDNCSSVDPMQSEFGSSIFATLADTAPDQFIPHIDAISQMFTAAMAANEASGNMVNPTIYNILIGMGHLVPFIIGHNSAEHAYQQAIPSIVKALQIFAMHDPDKFIEAFDNLENVADSGHRLITPHIQLLTEFCLELGQNEQYDSAVRVKAIVYIGFLIRLKKKIIVKLNLVEPIIHVLFKLMSAEPSTEDAEDEEYFTGEETVSSPIACATQTMDIIALHIAPEKLIPPLLAILDPALKGDDPLKKKAAYLSMAVIAEGCSETICNKYIRPLLDCVKVGITESNPIVRNAALFALGQFSEHLQPEISQYANEILPILFEFLQQVVNQINSTGKEPKHVDRLFYALETFCENLDAELIPHLPLLMERLFDALSSKNSVHLRELVLSIISSAASAAKTGMLPFFPRLIEELKMYLTKTDNEDIITLRPGAVDSLACLARNIGKENFLPLVSDTLNIGLSLMEENDDPDLKQSCYNLFAALGEVVGPQMNDALPKIVETMILSVKSTEGIQPEYKDEDGDLDGIGGDGDGPDDNEYDIENSENDDDDDDEDVTGFYVENAYMDEKEEAIVALKELAEYTGPAFAPYLQTSFEEIYKLITFPNEDIRKVSIEALAQFTISFYELNNAEATLNAVTILVPKFCEIINTDEERTVVMAAIYGFSELFKKLKTNINLKEDQKEAIFDCITKVLNNKVACQFSDPGDEELGESEYDDAIIEAAADLIPQFGSVLPPQQFALYFGRVVQFFLDKIEKSKRNSESKHAFAIGVISECFKPLKEYTAPWIPTFLPILMAGVKDSVDEVRNNSVFGLGELVANSDEASFPHYPAILTVLSEAVAVETHALTLDNICGAIARLIITNSMLVPLKQVLPVFIKYLPLREDFEENFAVYKCLNVVYTQGREELIEHLDHIIALGLQVLFKKEYNGDEARNFILNFLIQIRQDFNDRFMVVVNSITIPEFAQFVASL